MFNSSINNSIPVPVGTVIMSPAPNIEGYLLCNGASPNWALYPRLKAVLGSLYGNALPDFRGRFIRGAGGAAAAIGTPQAGGAPEIAGSGSSHNGSLSSSMSGAFASTSTGPSVPASTGAGFTYGFNFAASRANALYGSASEIRPINHALNFFIKY